MESRRCPFSWPISPESISRETAVFERELAEAGAGSGPDGRVVLAARSRLGRAYHFAGRYLDTIELQAVNVDACLRLLGEDHPDTLAARGDLARSWLSAGRLADGVAGLERSLADFERVLGADHPDAVLARSDLGTALVLTGALARARPSLEQARTDSGERSEPIIRTRWRAATSSPWCTWPRGGSPWGPSWSSRTWGPASGPCRPVTCKKSPAAPAWARFTGPPSGWRRPLPRSSGRARTTSVSSAPITHRPSTGVPRSPTLTRKPDSTKPLSPCSSRSPPALTGCSAQITR